MFPTQTLLKTSQSSSSPPPPPPLPPPPLWRLRQSRELQRCPMRAHRLRLRTSIDGGDSPA